MSIMRSWRRWPRSVSCARRSSSNRDPNPTLAPSRSASITKTSDEHGSCYRIRLPALEAAKFDAALASHRDALFAEWKRDHDEDAEAQISGRRCRTTLMRLCVWSMRGGMPRRRAARTGIAPRWWCISMSRTGSRRCIWVRCSSDSDRQYLLCDATCEVWFERDGQVIGSGRATRTISRRLRRALRAPPSHVRGAGLWGDPGFACTPLRHWEDGGETELDNLVLLCPTIIGCTIAASSPSPDPQTSSLSLTVRVAN